MVEPKTPQAIWQADDALARPDDPQWNWPVIVSNLLDLIKVRERVSACSDHKPVQHRDGCPPWCHPCGLTADGYRPKSLLDPIDGARS